jgi:hypothetical protein|tara:strand:- start:277 stop:492 length:216 start_codon:yes stop_codon:yes gene_type:complete
MTTLFAAFVAFSLVMVAMAVGVIFSNREIQGSCGGLNKMSDDFGRPMCECGKAPGTCGEEQESTVELAQTV